MRRKVTISLPQEMYDYVDAERGMGTMSEYIRSLVRGEQRRRAEERTRPLGSVTRARDIHVVVEARRQLDKLRDILDGNTRFYSDE